MKNQRTNSRLQRLEARLLKHREQGQPLRVVEVFEDVDGRIVKGAEYLPGGADYKPGQLILHIVETKRDRPA